MGINRRDENTIYKPFDGVTQTVLTGKETGSKMLSVNQYELDPNSKSDYYETVSYTHLTLPTSDLV